LIAESDRRLYQPERRSVVRLLTRVERGAHRHPYVKRRGDTKPAYVSGFRPHNVHALGTAPIDGQLFPHMQTRINRSRAQPASLFQVAKGFPYAHTSIFD
jgi:hypothetical protein